MVFGKLFEKRTNYSRAFTYLEVGGRNILIVYFILFIKMGVTTEFETLEEQFLELIGEFRTLTVS